jgi:DNA-binding transcriptional LysR family regulator
MVSMRALECLVQVVEQGSLTKAAAVLHLSQPALSHQIAAIERELKTPVIERLPRGIRPTAAGQADVTIGPRPARTDEHVELLGREEIVVVASPQHRFSGMAAVPLAELAAEPLVHYDAGNGFGAWVDRFAAQRGVMLPHPALRTADPRTAAQLAAAGMGVTIVPSSALGLLPGETVRPLDPPELRDVIAIVAAPHDDLIRRFVSHLKRRGLTDLCERRRSWLSLGEPAKDSEENAAALLPHDTGLLPDLTVWTATAGGILRQGQTRVRRGQCLTVSII